MEMTVLMDFEICDDHIKTPAGHYYLFRIQPPNLSILNENERLEKIKNLESFLDSNDNPFQIFVLDKTEDLSLNKQFWQDIDDRYDFISNTVLAAIEEMQNDSRGVQRAFYIVVCIKRKSDHELFFEQLKNNEFECYVVKKNELITVMRNFILREFSDFDIQTFDKEVQALYEKQKYH
ncbi:MAG: hypothetical protein ACERKO_04295 [Acetanaerobacterium sp.]